MGKRKRPKRQAPQPVASVEPPKKGRWWKVPLEVITIISAILGIAGFVLSTIPKLSLDAAGSLQSTSPMGTVFYLSNDGALPIHDVVVTCGNLEITGQNLRITNFGLEMQPHPEARAETLSPGHKMTLPYAPAFGFTAINNFTGAQLVIRARYRPDFVPWRTTETFPFQAVRAADGTWIWKSIPR